MKTENKKEDMLDLEKAKQIIDKKNKEDIEICGKEIEEAIKSICDKYKCRIVIVGEFDGNNIKTGINILKNE